MCPRVETPRRHVSKSASCARPVLFLCATATHAVLAACSGTADAPTTTPTAIDPPGLTRITFENADGAEVDLLVEIADTPEERSRGLMFRESLPENQGMLFIFEQDGQHNFYMRDTLIPLSIAFIEADGIVVEIEDMEPQTEDLHSAPEPFRYAVEANQGWFDRNGIKAGSRALIPSLGPGPTLPPDRSPLPR
jgi:uncharacterized membrane protein (UPF0127 family)